MGTVFIGYFQEGTYEDNSIHVPGVLTSLFLIGVCTPDMEDGQATTRSDSQLNNSLFLTKNDCKLIVLSSFFPVNQELS